MLAFTDSIEAAQNRVTDAVDQWALWANGAEAMKNFYNILAYVIRNLDTFGITIGGECVKHCSWRNWKSW